ncbi:MAG: sensor domain-containing phosphodiesterase [Mycobacterium sp.]
MVVPVDIATSSEVRESVVVIDGKGQILSFDAGAEHSFGYSAAEVIGRNVRLLMPEPYQSAHDQYLSDYRRTGEAHIIGIGRKVRATRKDGSDFPVQLSVIETEFRGSPAFAGILRDITAQDAADVESGARELASDAPSKATLELGHQNPDAEMRYRLLADNSVDVVAHIRGLNVAWVSPSVEAAFGWPPEQWIGTDFTRRIHPDDLTTVAAALQEAAQRGWAIARARLGTADGGYRWVECNGKLYVDAEGNTDGMIGALRVVDEQVRAEQQLMADRERFEAILGNAPSAISVRDLQHRYTTANKSFCQLFGKHSAAEVIGRTEDEILPPEVLERSRRAAVRTLTGESFFEEESIDPGPEPIWFITQHFPLRNSGGEITELVTIRTDITHRKKIEQEAAERAVWDERISSAIADGRLLVYSQPILDIATRRIVEEELLVRLRTVETAEILPPSEFVPQCEQYGLIPVIDRYMVARAIELACTDRHVCVNIAGQTIGDPQAMSEIFDSLTTAGPDVTNKIVFEITETTALAAPAIAKTFSQGMRDLGCRVALDDFGTGYGTFTDLRQLDLDTLKIDLSFVQKMLEDRDDKRVVNTIHVVARTYGLTTVAEGVETQEVLEALAELGVDRAQGNLVGEPKPIVW